MYDDKELEAIKRYESLEKPNFSQNIAEFITAGYGKLDEYGEWEYPLPYQYVMRAYQNG